MARRRNISRYRAASGEEGAFQPGSRGRVLRNRLGIISKREIDRIEFRLLARAQQESVQTTTATTVFTAAILRRMHRRWLHSVYDWAGRYRTVELAKGGFRWPPARLVEANMDTFSSETLAQLTPCRPAALELVAHRLAVVHAELLLIHPFRDGNGRLARWLANLMTLQAGFPPPEYGFTGRGSPQQRVEYLQAVTRGYRCDYGALTGFFIRAIERRRRRFDMDLTSGSE
jgi:cell filamentation protein